MKHSFNIKPAVFALFFSIFFAGGVAAQTIDISLNPPIIESVAKPGAVFRIDYSAKNHADPIFIKAKILPASPDRSGVLQIGQKEDGRVVFGPSEGGLPIGETVFLKSNEKKDYKIAVSIPKNIREQDYYYVFVVESQPFSQQDGEKSAQSIVQVASLILITVTETGKTEMNAQIVDFGSDTRYKLDLFGRSFSIADSSDVVSFKLTIKNKGKHRIKPRGAVKVKGSFGDVASHDIIAKNILAESTRLISVSSHGFFLGKNTFSGEVDLGEEGSPKLYVSSQFYAFPFKFVLSILLIAGIIAFIVHKTGIK